MKDPWALYNALIQDIPDLPVDEAVIGPRRAMVRSGNRVGVTVTAPGMDGHKILPAEIGSLKLRQLAEGAKSWNFVEACLGTAAINAYWNSPELPWIKKAMEAPDTDAFVQYRQAAAGKKVGVIGHFCHLERTLMDVCDLSIIERQPRPGDYPDPACEYLLPRQDMVFATGVTVVNKTLGRLLELSAHCGMILVGPSVPLCPRLFDFGVRDLQGFVVTDAALCRRVINGEGPRIFDAGKRISLSCQQSAFPEI